MEKVLFLYYPKCSTCQKAQKWLDENRLSYQGRHIVEQNPTAEELKSWQEMSGVEVKSLFNTSGLRYKALKLKEKLPTMSDEEKFALLATDGMLVKRPLLVGDNFVLAGFNPRVWADILKVL